MNEILTHLCRFVGYGSKNAKVIFIGKEEKAQDANANLYRERLRIQSGLAPFEDLGHLCERLTKAGLYNPQDSSPQPTWSPLCSVMLGINGKMSQMGQLPAIIEYQRNELGRIDGDNLLAELFPVPKSGASVFGAIHRELLEMRDIEEYHQTVFPVRRKLLGQMLVDRFAGGEKSRPRLIVGYGRPWSDFELIFREAVGQIQYTYDFSGRIKWAKMNGCLFVLTYHPMCRGEYECNKFDSSVAGRILEVYGEPQRPANP
jgi:hypothetical protein